MASTKSKVKKAAKKAIKKNPKAVIIAVVAIILIIAIAAVVIYFKFPDTFNSIFNSFYEEDQANNSNSYSSSLKQGEGELLVNFLNVGQGDCIYIQFPDGKDMIIDCGNKSSGYNYADTKKFLTDRNPDGIINYLMLTHCDEDHVDHLDDIIYDFEIKNIYMPNVYAVPTDETLLNKVEALNVHNRFTDTDVVDTAVYAKFFIAAFSETNCNVYLNIDSNDGKNSIKILEETYSLVFYCPTQEYYDSTKLNTAHLKNAISPIGILEYNGRKIVLSGDANEESEKLIIPRIGSIDCDVLKVGHHGSATSSTNEWLNAINCEYAVISCNYYGNTFNHPTQIALDRFISRNYTIYRTDLNGNIILKVDKDGNLSFTVDTEANQSDEKNGISLDDVDEIKNLKQRLSNKEITEKQYDDQVAAIVGYYKIED